MMWKKGFLTFKILAVVLSLRIGQVRETVQIARLRTITDHAAILEKHGG